MRITNNLTSGRGHMLHKLECIKSWKWESIHGQRRRIKEPNSSSTPWKKDISITHLMPTIQYACTCVSLIFESMHKKKKMGIQVSIITWIYEREHQSIGTAVQLLRIRMHFHGYLFSTQIADGQRLLVEGGLRTVGGVVPLCTSWLLITQRQSSIVADALPPPWLSWQLEGESWVQSYDLDAVGSILAMPRSTEITCFVDHFNKQECLCVAAAFWTNIATRIPGRG